MIDTEAGMKTKLILDVVTCIDYGYFDENGVLSGGSYVPTLLVGGRIEETESVICDFSTIKGMLKKLIDHKITGVDHKLLVDSSIHTLDYYKTDRVRVRTPNFYGDLPVDAIIDIKYANDGNTISDYLSTYLTKATGYEVSVLNNSNPILPSIPSAYQTTVYTMFRYNHPLKNSTSYGCQNAGHGHLSYILPLFNSDVALTDRHKDEISNAMHQVTNAVDGAYFVMSDNVTLQTTDEVHIEYETSSRGFFKVSLPRKQVIILDTETTVEYLGPYIANLLKVNLRGTDVYRHYRGAVVSEGLFKGSIVLL